MINDEVVLPAFLAGSGALVNCVGILRESGLVDAEKIGPWMWYRRNEKALRELAHALERQL